MNLVSRCRKGKETSTVKLVGEGDPLPLVAQGVLYSVYGQLVAGNLKAMDVGTCASVGHNVWKKQGTTNVVTASSLCPPQTKYRALRLSADIIEALSKDDGAEINVVMPCRILPTDLDCHSCPTPPPAPLGSPACPPLHFPRPFLFPVPPVKDPCSRQDPANGILCMGQSDSKLFAVVAVDKITPQSLGECGGPAKLTKHVLEMKGECPKPSTNGRTWKTLIDSTPSLAHACKHKRLKKEGVEHVMFVHTLRKEIAVEGTMRIVDYERHLGRPPAAWGFIPDCLHSQLQGGTAHGKIAKQRPNETSARPTGMAARLSQLGDDEFKKALDGKDTALVQLSERSEYKKKYKDMPDDEKRAPGKGNTRSIEFNLSLIKRYRELKAEGNLHPEAPFFLPPSPGLHNQPRQRIPLPFLDPPPGTYSIVSFLSLAFPPLYSPPPPSPPLRFPSRSSRSSPYVSHP